MEVNKIYNCTIECANRCYVKSLLVYAKNEDEAQDKVYHYVNSDTKYPQRITYTSKLKEIEGGDVIKVGFGSNPRL